MASPATDEVFRPQAKSREATRNQAITAEDVIRRVLEIAQAGVDTVREIADIRRDVIDVTPIDAKVEDGDRDSD